MKPATPKIRELLHKLERMAARGIGGEREAAENKLRRLQRRYDFSGPDTTPQDLFAGTFKASSYALPILGAADTDIANSIKWAIEGRTGIACVFQASGLAAQAVPDTAKNLSTIASTISTSFGGLWDRFSKTPGVLPADRRCFVMGLYDGMMDEQRPDGQSLPARAQAPKPKGKRKAKAIGIIVDLSVHPYTVAQMLGKQIRFSVPLDRIENNLDDIVQKQLPSA